MQHQIGTLTSSDILSINYSTSIYKNNLNYGVVAMATLQVRTVKPLTIGQTYTYSVDNNTIGVFNCKSVVKNDDSYQITLYDNACNLSSSERQALEADTTKFYYYNSNGTQTSGTYSDLSPVTLHDYNYFTADVGMATIAGYNAISIRMPQQYGLTFGKKFIIYVSSEEQYSGYVQSISWDLDSYTIGCQTTEVDNAESQIDKVVTQMAGYNQRFENNERRIGIVITDQDEVDRAAIVASINEDGSSTALIQADKVNLVGAVTFESMSASTKGNIVTSTVVEYALSTSETVAPTSGWSTTAPAHESGKYMWQRTTTTKANGQSSTSSPTCIQGADGQQGATGPQGPSGQDGDDGVGVYNQVQYWAYGNIDGPTQSWSTTKPAVSSEYLRWTKTVTTYTDGSSFTTSPWIDDAESRIASWCATNDKTKIDGGKIYTGSITANQINANAITTEKINAGAITTEKLSSNGLVVHGTVDMTEDFGSEAAVVDIHTSNYNMRNRMSLASNILQSNGSWQGYIGMSAMLRSISLSNYVDGTNASTIVSTDNVVTPRIRLTSSTSAPSNPQNGDIYFELLD